MGVNHWAMGTGLETFSSEYPRYQSIGLAQAFPNRYHESPHNMFLDALTGQGVWGLAVLALLAAVGVFSAWRAKRRDFSVSGYLACSLVAAIWANQFLAFTVPTALYFYVGTALIVAMMNPRSRLQGKSMPVWGWLVTVPIAFASVLFAWQLGTADRKLTKLNRAFHAGNVEETIRLYNEELLSPGVLANIFGQNLTNGCTEFAPGVPWPTTLCDMQVLVDDLPAAIVSASPSQFSVQLPVDALPGPATLTLQQPSTVPLSFALSITLETHAPGIFAVTHQDLSPISMGSPAIPGETLRITATGLGPTSPPVATGVPGPVPPAVAVTMPDVKIADMDAPVVSATSTPFLVGLFDVVFTLPADLAEGTHALTLEIGGQTSNAVMIPVGAAPQPPPSIGAGGVILANLVPTVRSISPNSIISVFGVDLAAEGTFKILRDLVDDKVPTQLADVCAEVNGIRTPMFFVSPGQLNVQAPTLGALGPVTVEVITGCGGSSEQKSAPEMVTVDAVTPAFFLKVFTDPGPIAALHLDFTEVGDPNVIAGATPAQPGTFISLFATGFGPTNPPLQAGEVPQFALPDSFGQARVTGNVTSVTIGGIPLDPDNANEVFYIGTAPCCAGLYQLVVKVPVNAPDGDLPVVVTIDGVSTPEGPFVTVQTP